MKKNIYGITIAFISIINILFMIYCYFIYDMGANNNIYIIGGTIISIGLLILLFKNNIYGYIGTIIFYGIQILGTELVFNNFRYGYVLRSQTKFSINSAELPLDINFTAILLMIIGIFGYYRFKKLTEIKAEI